MSEREIDRIIRLRTVIERTGLSRTTIYRKIQEGSFPAQIKIAERCSGWREAAVEHWLADPMGYSAASNGNVDGLV